MRWCEAVGTGVAAAGIEFICYLPTRYCRCDRNNGYV